MNVVAVTHQHDLRQRRIFSQKLADLLDRDPCRLIDRIAVDTATDRWKRDGPESVRNGQFQ